MEIIATDSMNFGKQPVLVTVDYFSGNIIVDPLKSETSSVVAARINDNIRKFGLAERSLSDNGPCFRSETFQNFCESLEMHHSKSSPYYHQSNGRVERAIQAVRKIFKKSKSDVEVTKALLAYHDTPISSELPSPAELFLNRRINTRLAHLHQPSTLSDEQKQHLQDKRALHLKPGVKRGHVYTPDETVWFTDEASADWKPGIIESRDQHPDSYWLINTENDHRIRRNKHTIKPRYPPRLTQPHAKQTVHETIPQYPEKVEEQQPHESTEVPNQQTGFQ